MAQKNQDKGVAGAVPAVSDPGRVRNVVLVGHSGAGKTSLVEALLAATGTISRAGSVTEGTTVVRLRPRRGEAAAVGGARLRADRCTTASRSTCSTPPATPTSSASCGPGCAPPTPPCSWSPSVDGMDAATAALWEECAAVGMPRAVAITRLDHQRADFDETLAECQRVFGDNVLPLYLPLHGDDGQSRRRPDRA